MKSLPQDRTLEGQQIHYQMLSRLPASKRLAPAFELTQAVRKLILTDLKQRFPQASVEEIRRRFIARVLPRADVIRVYGFDPHEEGY
jgi:hypothetical protein